MTYAENIIRVYSSATDDERTEGMSWYNTYHDYALDLSPGDVWRGAGVIAAYSPNNHWNRNLYLATESLKSGTAQGGYLPKQIIKVQRILNGEPTLDVLRGQKERAFAAAIATNGLSDIATIDRHAHDVAMGRVTEEGKKGIPKSTFNAMVDAYRQAAIDAGTMVAQMQAITWVVWRNRKGDINAGSLRQAFSFQ